MNWTGEHWINLGLFIASTLLVGLGSVHDWSEIRQSITPANVSGFGLGVLTFLRTMYTNKPRNPNMGERRSDPFNTAPVAIDERGTAVPVPPVTVGRPVDPDKPKEVA